MWCCFTCQSYGLLDGHSKAQFPRPSAVSIKICLQETSIKQIKTTNKSFVNWFPEESKYWASVERLLAQPIVWVWRRVYQFCLNNNRQADSLFVFYPDVVAEFLDLLHIITDPVCNPPSEQWGRTSCLKENNSLSFLCLLLSLTDLWVLWRAWVTLTEGFCECRVANDYVDLNYNHISSLHLRECWPEDEFQFILALCKLLFQC